MSVEGGPAGLVQRLRARAHAFQALSWSQRRALVQAAVLMIALAVALRVVTLRQVRRVLAGTAPGPRRSTAMDEAATAVELARLVDMASRQVPVAVSCLPRSLTLWWLLKRRGIASEIRIGARKVRGVFEAHAWVERRGVVVGDDGDVASGYVLLSGVAPDGWA